MQAVEPRPYVAVLMAVYNGANWIEPQILSVLNQKNVNLEIFISVDPSNDESYKICNTLSEKNPRVKVLPTIKKSGGSAKNFFRLIADVNIEAFDYVSFCDQDDIWNKNKLHIACTCLREMSIDAYSSNVTAFWPSGKQSLVNKSQKQVKYDFLFEAAGPGCTYVLNKRLIMAIKDLVLLKRNDINQITHHDWLLYAYARAKGFSWYIDSKPTMLYRQHSKNVVGVNIGLLAYLSRYNDFLSGSWLKQSVLIADLVDINKDPFVHTWSTLDRLSILRLCLMTNICRRRTRDRIAFFILCLLTGVNGIR